MTAYNQQLQLDDQTIDLVSGTIEGPRQARSLTPRELALLDYLAHRPGLPISREELLQHAFGYRPGVRSRAVDKVMVTLRKKIERNPSRPLYLQAVPGGYRLQPPAPPPLPEVHSGQPERLRVAPTPFVGRKTELQQLQQRLQAPGWIALVGLGGVGKTRLAHHITEAHAAVGGSSASCSLADAHSTAEVLAKIAASVGVQLGRSAGVTELTTAMRGRGPLLLLLDRVEHLLQELDLLQELVQGVPELRLLTTSRIASGHPAERVFVVEPLVHDDAMALLEERARERGYATPHDGLGPLADALARIPLAIELAAPWLGTMSAEVLRSRLGERLRLPGGRGDALASVLDETLDLLGPPGRESLAALSVFQGPFDAEAAEAILHRDDAPELLDALVRASLLQRGDEGQRVLLSMLDPVRAYASALLAGDPEARSQVLDRHLQHFSSLQGASRNVVDDVLAAGERALSEGLPDRALACLRLLDRMVMAVSVARIAPFAERVVLSRLLRGSQAGEAILLFGYTSMVLGDLQTAEGALTEGLSLVRGNARTTASALHRLGLVARHRCDLVSARKHYEEALELLVDPHPRAVCLSALGILARREGRLSDSEALLKRSIELAKGNHYLESHATAELSLTLHCRGALLAARYAYQAAIELATPLASWNWVRRLHCLYTSNEISLGGGREAIDHYHALYTELARWDSEDNVLAARATLSQALLIAGDLPAAAELWGSRTASSRLPMTEATVRSALGHLWLVEGEPQEALRELERAIELLEKTNKHKLIEALCLTAIAQARSDRLDHAERALARAMTLAEEQQLLATSPARRWLDEVMLELQRT